MHWRSLPFSILYWASQVALAIKNPPANAGDIRNTGLIPGSRRSLGGRHGNPCQYSCLENSMDRGAWRATVHRVAWSQTQLKWLSTHAYPTAFVLLFLLHFSSQRNIKRHQSEIQVWFLMSLIRSCPDNWEVKTKMIVYIILNADHFKVHCNEINCKR